MENRVAKPHAEEPDAVVPHVRICGGRELAEKAMGAGLRPNPKGMETPPDPTAYRPLALPD